MSSIQKNELIRTTFRSI